MRSYVFAHNTSYIRVCGWVPLNFGYSFVYGSRYHSTEIAMSICKQGTIHFVCD